MRIEEVLEEALQLVKPGKEEEAKVARVAEKVSCKVEQIVESQGLDASVRVLGSVAKGTWVRGDCDIDVFVLYPPSVGENVLGDTVKIGIQVFEELGGRWILRYAEHPYVEGWIEGLRVNIVPGCRSKPGSWVTPVDRTPYHTDYVLSKLRSEEQRDQVRLLKKFMKVIGVYGADIKTGGFSGYLCELLIIRFRSFLETIRSASRGWRGTVIDLEGYYRDLDTALKAFGNPPLLVVDPVDPRRNVASPVTLTKLSEFTAASAFFLRKPTVKFFKPPRPTRSIEDVERLIQLGGTSLVALAFSEPSLPPDTLWGEIRRSLKAFVKLLENWEFKVIRSSAWSGEGFTVFLVELESRRLPPVKLHKGPPVDSPEAFRFTGRYLGEDRVSGPWIEGDRWYVARRRRYVDVVSLVKDVLEGSLTSLGFSKDIASSISKDCKLYVDSELVRLAEKSKKLAEYLHDFLDGRPVWLRFGELEDTPR